MFSLTNAFPVLLSGGGGGVAGIALPSFKLRTPALLKLAGVFLDLARGFDILIGMVVVISSASHLSLSRSGTAAYAGDLVRSTDGNLPFGKRIMEVCFPWSGNDNW